jgi:phosphatidylglycerol:prolipoprotein diacylglycerol transferase
VAIGHTIGRLGCFSAGCCWGKPTTSWIGVHFTQKAAEITGVPINAALIPTQLIEAAANLAIFGLLLLLRRRRAFDGQIIFTYLMAYGVARFTIEFWRDDPRGVVFGMSTSQFISILMFILGAGLSFYHWRRTSSSRVGGQEKVAAEAS